MITLGSIGPLFATDHESVSFLTDPIDYMRALDFLHPDRLWWLLGLLGLALIYVIMQFRRRAFAVRFTNVELLDKVVPDRARWNKHIPPTLLLLAMTLGIVAFAEPQRVVPVPGERATIIMAIDTSLSMLADDVRPSRIEGAKGAALEFVDDLPPKINLGLVSYHGNAFIRVPPTQNRESVKAAIKALELGPATATGEAIFASLVAIADIIPDDDGGTPPARVVLMSDGKRTAGRTDDEAIEAARQAGIAISTIAFGTERGTIVLPENPEQVIPVPVDYEALSLIADGTGGEFFTAASTSELRSVYANIGSSIGFEEELRPVNAPFIGTALVLLAAAWLLSLLWRVSLPG